MYWNVVTVLGKAGRVKTGFGAGLGKGSGMNSGRSIGIEDLIFEAV